MDMGRCPYIYELDSTFAHAHPHAIEGCDKFRVLLQVVSKSLNFYLVFWRRRLNIVIIVVKSILFNAMKQFPSIGSCQIGNVNLFYILFLLFQLKTVISLHRHEISSSQLYHLLLFMRLSVDGFFDV